MIISIGPLLLSFLEPAFKVIPVLFFLMVIKSRFQIVDVKEECFAFMYRWLAPWHWLRGRQEEEGQPLEEQTSGTGDYRSPSPAEAIPRGSSPTSDSPARERQLSRTPINYPNMHSVPLTPAQVLLLCFISSILLLPFCQQRFKVTG